MLHKKLYATLLVIAAGAAAVFFALSRQPEEAISELQAFLPFKPGVVFTYRYRLPGGKDQYFNVLPSAIRSHKPYPVMEFLRIEGKHAQYHYWTATPEGLRPLLPVSKGGQLGFTEPGFQDGYKHGLHFPAKAVAGYKWTWSEPSIGQVLVNPDGTLPPPSPPNQYEGKVLAVDKQIKVSFGTVKATVVEISSDDHVATRSYWVKGLGVVRRESLDNHGKATQVEELVSIQPKENKPIASKSLT